MRMRTCPQALVGWKSKQRGEFPGGIGRSLKILVRHFTGNRRIVRLLQLGRLVRQGAQPCLGGHRGSIGLLMDSWQLPTSGSLVLFIPNLINYLTMTSSSLSRWSGPWSSSGRWPPRALRCLVSRHRVPKYSSVRRLPCNSDFLGPGGYVYMIEGRMHVILLIGVCNATDIWQIHDILLNALFQSLWCRAKRCVFVMRSDPP